MLKELVDVIKLLLPAKGEDGESITLADVEPMLEEVVSITVSTIKLPQVDNDAVKTFVLDEVAKTPALKDGKSVRPEEWEPFINQAVKSAIATIPKPKNGILDRHADKVDLGAIQTMFEAAVKLEIPEIPAPKNGEMGKGAQPGKDADSIDMNSVQKMIDSFVHKAVFEAVKKAVAQIKILEHCNGDDGRHALNIKILPEIDTEKSYVRGTYAKHVGGFWHPFERTHGMRGWEPVVVGIVAIQIEYDDDCGVKIVTAKSAVKLFPKIS